MPTTTRPGGRRRIFTTGFAALIALAALVAVVVANGINAADRRRAAERIHVHTLDVLLSTSELKASVNAALRGERGYLLTGDPRFLSPYTASRLAIPRLTADLGRLTRDNPRQRAHIVRLADGMNAFFDVLETTIALEKAGREDGAYAIVRAGRGRESIHHVLGILGAMEAEERRLLTFRRIGTDAANVRIERYGIALAALAVLLLLIAAAAGAMSLRAHRRLIRATVELERIATTDLLTGLPNRRAFLTALETEILRACRSGEPLSLAILDIDHFKRVNDRHGHPAGDAVLVDAAEKMRAAVRAGDVVGRIGGEEFAILMPSTPTDGAALVCERLRAAIGARPVDVAGTIGVAVTLSTGIALLRAGELSDGLISRADAALYEAKTAGRNRVRLAA